MSLVELAALKRLPRHQYTDRATVRWIVANRPDFTDRPALRPPLRPASLRLLARSAVPAGWWAEARTAESLHGTRHAMRTAALAAMLAERTGLGEDETADLVLAAAVHDCRRLHDQDDRGHGRRAAAWLTERADQVWAHFHLTAAPHRVVRAATAIRLHDVPYSAFTSGDTADHARAARVCDLLKAADALDRYRLPKLSWWPDPAHVRIRPDVFDRLRATAFDLVVRSETARLAGCDSGHAVLRALEPLDLRELLA
ncbi:hypothetical protein [Streptomyces sp. NBC_01477]|uniref:hypothetical protein n=1 Tax=Streptomyces sp. NBC_01477 TaxID=2976015 RepID=UPI002E334FD8|nr:hypothetical protein [Streptomyces sp. NBC_01477]